MPLDPNAAFELLELLIERETPVPAGMEELLRFCRQQAPSPVWDRVAALPYAEDVARLEGWLRALLTSEPPGEDIIAFWFGLFDAIGEDDQPLALLYLAGSANFDPDDENAEWAIEPTYWPEGRYADSAILAEIPRALADAGDEADEGAYLLCFSYACLAVGHLCRTLDPALLLRTSAGTVVEGRAVAVGYDEGDFLLLGEIAAEE